jgi:hypothetical protein
MEVRYVCEQCHWKGPESQLLSAPHPFQAPDLMLGCPQCREADKLTRLCDEPGCWERVVGGSSSPTGYRFTCHTHFPRDVENKKD